MTTVNRLGIEWNFGQAYKDFLIGIAFIPNVTLTVAEDEDTNEEDREVFDIDILSIGLLIIKLNIITRCQRVN